MAFFLGAGVSRAAGIPSGRHVLEDTCLRYYQASCGTDPEDGLDLLTWAQDSIGSEVVGYSQILEKMFPSPAARQAYLRGFFEGKEPTEAHHSLAKLAADGWVRVFITTNFDHLMEDALTSAGVSWTRVSSADEVETARPREHSEAYILKLHGDYTSSGIRNTPAELEMLDESLAREFRDVLRSYGIVFVGYGGQDAGVTKVLRENRARYGVYWALHSDPDAVQENLLRSLDAQRIHVTDADSFCSDLYRRVQAVARHPDGKTPEQHRREVIELVRLHDDVGVRLRAKVLAQRLFNEVVQFGETHLREPWWPTSTRLTDEFKSWIPVVDPVLDALGPVIDAYVSAAQVAGEFESAAYVHFVRPLVRLLRFEVSRGGLDPVVHLGQASAILVGYSLLVSAVLTDNWRMFVKTVNEIDPTSGTSWMLTLPFHHSHFFHRGNASHVGDMVLRWLSMSNYIRMIKEPGQECLDAACQANVLLCIAERTRDQRSRPSFFWGLRFYGTRLESLIRKISYDPEVARTLAGLTGGGASDFRRHFYDIYRAEIGNERYWRWAPDPVEDEVLNLLVKGEGGMSAG